MGGPSRSTRGREDAIETLIDMDPNGSAFRVAKTMVSIELYITFLLAVVCMSVCHVVWKRLLALLFCCWVLLHYYTVLSVYVFILYVVYIILSLSFISCVLQHYYP